MTGEYVVTVDVPKPDWLSANRPLTNRGHLQAIRDRLHYRSALAARVAGIPRISGPSDVLWTIHYPKGVGWVHGDATNSQPTTKALLDGLVHAGFLAGDGPREVVSEKFTRGPNLDVPGLHRVVVTITPRTE
jgi:hypothetical protein